MHCFPSDLQAAFAANALPRSASEVQLFRALQDAIRSLGRRYVVEEYHGTKSQVSFTPSMLWRPGAGRCELADLLVITYQRRPVREARFTFLQCKRDRAADTHVLTGDTRRFSGNYEQWDLLHSRPLFTPLGSVRPPADILSSATLPSVGSFGVFGWDGVRWDMAYVSADQLQPTPSRLVRHGPLSIAPAAPRYRTTGGFREATLACCLEIFGQALEGVSVGTPMFQAPRSTQEWLSTVVATMAATSTAPYAAELAGLLRGNADLGIADPLSGAAPNTVLLVVEDGAVPLRDRNAG